LYFFVFQAEDGIRDFHVTGVQTCALPISGDDMLADGLISWLAGQPNVAASVKRAAGIKGDLDHFGATNFLVGLLTILRDSGYSEIGRASCRERGWKHECAG